MHGKFSKGKKLKVAESTCQTVIFYKTKQTLRKCKMFEKFYFSKLNQSRLEKLTDPDYNYSKIENSQKHFR